MKPPRSFVLRLPRPQVCTCWPSERVVTAEGGCWRCLAPEVPSPSADELRRARGRVL